MHCCSCIIWTGFVQCVYMKGTPRYNIKCPQWLRECVWFTDGSCSMSGSGGGEYNDSVSPWWSPWMYMFRSLSPRYCISWWQLEHVVEGLDVAERSAQSAFRLINYYRAASCLFLECQNKLEMLSNTYQINLVWMPGHYGVRRWMSLPGDGPCGAGARSVASTPVHQEEDEWLPSQEHKQCWSAEQGLMDEGSHGPSSLDQISGCFQAGVLGGGVTRADDQV